MSNLSSLIRILLPAAFMGLVVSNCIVKDDDDDNTDECDDGATRACNCTDGSDGERTCDNGEFGSCVCDDGPTGGRASTGGASSTGGTLTTGGTNSSQGGTSAGEAGYGGDGGDGGWGGDPVDGGYGGDGGYSGSATTGGSPATGGTGGVAPAGGGEGGEAGDTSFTPNACDDCAADECGPEWEACNIEADPNGQCAMEYLCITACTEAIREDLPAGTSISAEEVTQDCVIDTCNLTFWPVGPDAVNLIDCLAGINEWETAEMPWADSPCRADCFDSTAQ